MTLLPAAKRQLGASHWFPLFGGVIAAYAMLADEDEAKDEDCILRGVNDDLAFEVRAFLFSFAYNFKKI